MFISGLVTAVAQKLEEDAEVILKDPVLISHTINEALIFDNSIRESFGYLEKDKEWPGTAAVFTSDSHKFQHWLDVEKQSTLMSNFSCYGSL